MDQMDLAMVKRLKILSAQRTRTRALSTQSQASESSIVGAPDNVPSIVPFLVLADMKGHESFPMSDP